MAPDTAAGFAGLPYEQQPHTPGTGPTKPKGEPMSKLGSCDHCEADAVVEANGRRGCVEHLDDTFRPIGQQLRVIANLAHGHDVAEALRRAD